MENSETETNYGSAAPLTAQVKALTQLLQGFAAADARTAVWSALKQFVSQYGYQRLAVFQQAPSQGIAEALRLYGDGDIAHHAEQHGHQRALTEAFRANEPVALSHMNANAEGRGHDGGQDESLIVPLADSAAGKSWAILAGGAPDVSPLARSLVHVATETAFDRARALSGAEGAAPVAGLLSPREVAILSWAAAGRTDADIGGELKISARTVRFHTDNAKRKLRVTTRIQAVTEALRLGLIKL